MAVEGFEIYKLLVEEVRETRKGRRELANMFTTLNLGGVGALGFLAKGEAAFSPAMLVFLCLALVATCVIWRMSNDYYTHVLKVKYDIIYDLENSLGIDPIQREYAGLSRRGPVKWFSVERAMPMLFVTGYAVLIATMTSWQDIVAGVEGAIGSVRALIGR